MKRGSKAGWRLRKNIGYLVRADLRFETSLTNRLHQHEVVISDAVQVASANQHVGLRSISRALV